MCLISYWNWTNFQMEYLNWGRVTLEALIPVRSRKLSNNKSVQYLDGWPLSLRPVYQS